MIERKLAPVHIGQHLKNELDYLELSASKYAKLIDVSPSSITRLIKGETGISAEMAVKFAATIGSTPEMWLRLQDDYELWFAKEAVDVSRLNRISSPTEKNVILN